VRGKKSVDWIGYVEIRRKNQEARHREEIQKRRGKGRSAHERHERNRISG
jgi:hypothetical protein